MTTVNRTPREIDATTQFTRGESWKPAAALPEIQKQPGWAYRWIRTSMAGAADNRNVSSKMREGWEPVSLTDHPELQLFVDADSKFKDGIEIGGLLLCKMPEEFVNQRNAHYNKATQAQAEAVDNSFMKENDARMPLFKEKKTEVRKFGKG